MAFRNWLNEDEKRVLEEGLLQILLGARDEIVKGGTWHPSPETRAAEQEIERIQKEILAGNGTISEFKEVCEQWKKVGTQTTEI